MKVAIGSYAETGLLLITKSWLNFLSFSSLTSGLISRFLGLYQTIFIKPGEIFAFYCKAYRKMLSVDSLLIPKVQQPLDLFLCTRVFFVMKNQLLCRVFGTVMLRYAKILAEAEARGRSAFEKMTWSNARSLNEMNVTQWTQMSAMREPPLYATIHDEWKEREGI